MPSSARWSLDAECDLLDPGEVGRVAHVAVQAGVVPVAAAETPRHDARQHEASAVVLCYQGAAGVSLSREQSGSLVLSMHVPQSACSSSFRSVMFVPSTGRRKTLRVKCHTRQYAYETNPAAHLAGVLPALEVSGAQHLGPNAAGIPGRVLGGGGVAAVTPGGRKHLHVGLQQDRTREAAWRAGEGEGQLHLWGCGVQHDENYQRLLFVCVLV